MKLKAFVRSFLVLSVLSVNIGCDQVTKSIAREALDYHEPIGLVDGVLTAIKVENTGAFLSLGHSLPQPAKTLLLIALPVVALAFAIAFLFIRVDIPRISTTGFCFVVGGGIGNIYDRIVYGSVTDFLHIDFQIFQTGIFNMADVSVVAGALLIFIGMGSKPRISRSTIRNQE